VRQQFRPKRYRTTAIIRWRHEVHVLVLFANVVGAFVTQGALPPTTRMWETRPGVILDNGIDSFCLEVAVAAPVSGVRLETWPGVVAESGQQTLTLHDDGFRGDRIAADLVYTSERLRFDTNQPWLHPPFYAYDSNSPAGVSIKDVGRLTITETSGQQTGFSQGPQFGILSATVPLVEVVTLSSDIAVSPHLINVQGTNLSVQRFVRGYSVGTADTTRKIYSALPDAFDFFIHFSAYRIERTPPNAGQNFTIGVQRPVQVNFTGTGQGMFNNTPTYGSSGRLLGVIGLDCYERGIWSHNCAHEILHQWSSYIGALPISDGQHYVSRSSVASLLGGYRWDEYSSGKWTLVCEEGRNGGTRVSSLDKYMMGLLPPEAVPTLRTYSETNPPPLFMCDGQITRAENEVTIQDIIAQYGTRVPGPDRAQRRFALGFVAESTGRLLNPVEMTFYDIFARHFTSAVPHGHPDPYIGYNWAPITRFFGEDTTWQSDVASLIKPRIASLERQPSGGIRLVVRGLSGRNYEVQGSIDLVRWMPLGTHVASDDGEFVFERENREEVNYFFRILDRS
jgi:hypothetical protein